MSMRPTGKFPFFMKLKIVIQTHIFNESEYF